MIGRRRARRRVVALTGGAVSPAHSAPRRCGDPLVGLARLVGRLLDGLGWETTGHSDRSLLRTRGAVVAVAGVLVLVAPVGVAALVAVVGWHLPPALERRRQRSAERDLVDETMLATELCAIAVHSGRTVPQAIDAVRPFVDGRIGDGFDRVSHAYRAGGLLDDLLSTMSDELGAAVVPLVTILRAAHTDGDPIEPALTRLADRLRDERRRLVETDVRRLSIRLLLPLVCCSLPGFVLIAVVPLVVGSLARLGG